MSAALAAALLVTTAAVVGTFLEHRYGNLHVSWPPLYGHWEPHLGPGTPAAILVAVAVVAYGPSLAARLPWRALLWSAWGTAMAWTFSLALVDGWQRGIALRLTTKYEYLQVINPVNRFHDIPAALRDFTHHIVIHSPDAWPAHVAGHPPAATLTFVLLDRIGLGGGAWAGVWCITVGATAAAAVLVTVRALCGEQLARRAAPFLVLAPAAVWMGTSADGYFTAVAAWAVAFLALAVTGHRPRSAGLASGLLFGLVVYLSYGLTLFAVIAGGVLLLGSRRLKPLPYVIAGFVVLPAVFTFVGFNWWEAYRLLVTRYYQGAGGIRPYWYWVWANLACTVLLVGPATVAGLRRAGAAPVRQGVRGCLRRPDGEPRLALLVGAALLALLAADLSGMSKAETERIWLPFVVWLLPAAAFLNRPRAWLTAQAALALLLNHLLVTGW
ncbi:membrane protein [Streptomyces sp. NRRL WC-3618]|nr:membrane protein [Streptomyces sp. NRRL WC-3618]